MGGGGIIIIVYLWITKWPEMKYIKAKLDDLSPDYGGVHITGVEFVCIYVPLGPGN